MKKKRATALSHAVSMLKPGGIIQLTDWVRVAHGSTKQLYFPDDDTGRVHTLIYEEQNPQRGFQELFEWDNGECLKGTISPSSISEKLWLPLLS